MSVLNTLKFIANHPLNEGQKLKAIVRFATWQVGCRLVPGEVVYEWVGGSKFLVRAGETGLTGNIYSGFQEFAEMAYLVHVLGREDLFVDVGANVGSYTILAGAAVGARGCSIEPVPATYQRLVENVRINHLEGTVDCHNIGIGNAPGILQFSSDMDVCNRALVPGESRAGGVGVQVLTLDSLLGDQAPALIKIDVEGYETAVLEGAENTLGKESLHSVIMEINGSGEKYGFDESRIFRKMSDFGFGRYSYSPFTREIAELIEVDAAQENTIFVRNIEWVRSKLRNAPAFSVNGRWL